MSSVPSLSASSTSKQAAVSESPGERFREQVGLSAHLKQQVAEGGATETLNEEEAREQLRLAQLYQAAKDENELLEFKNYELLFKIQELEQKQENILRKLEPAVGGQSGAKVAAASGRERSSTRFLAGQSQSVGKAAAEEHDCSHYDPNQQSGQQNFCSPSAAGGGMRPPTTNLLLACAPPVSSSELEALNNSAAGAFDGAKVGQQVCRADDCERAASVGLARLANGSEAPAADGSARRCEQARKGQNRPKQANGPHHEPLKCGSLTDLRATKSAGQLEHESMSHEAATAPPTQLEPPHGSGADYSRGARKTNSCAEAEPTKSDRCHDSRRDALSAATLASAHARPQSAPTNHEAARCNRPTSCERSLIEYNDDGLSALTSAPSSAKVTAHHHDDADEQTAKEAHAELEPSWNLLQLRRQFLEGEQSGQSEDKQQQQQQQESKMGNKSAAEEAKRLLGASQPNLSEPVGGARRASCNARIAVPVSRRSLAAGQQASSKQPASNQQQRLKVRSKSSLEQCSLARRSTSGQPTAPSSSANSSPLVKSQQQGAAQQKSAKEQTPRSKLTPNAQVKTQLSSANNKTQANNNNNNNNNKASLGAARLIRSRSRSSSSIGFVTQIPTLIGQSHAAKQQSQQQTEQPQQTHQEQSGAEKARREQAPELSVGSKSMSNLLGALESGARQEEKHDEWALERDSEPKDTKELDGLNKTSSMSSLLPKASARATSCVSLASGAAGAPPGGECAHCKQLEAKLEASERDKRQLREQLNELEELENDSRLMSQKLGQQLANLEQQLDSCKFQLDKSCEAESRAAFANKRLKFELEQRAESVGQLQAQLGRLQGRLLGALAEAERARQAQAEAQAQLAAAASEQRQQSDAAKTIAAPTNADSANKAHSTRNRLTAQSAPNGGKGAGASEPQQQQQPADESPALSLDGDCDSAIDLFDKPEAPSGGARATEPSGGGRSAGGGQRNADDSAYSKSSASSDANSDDGRSDSEQRRSEAAPGNNKGAAGDALEQQQLRRPSSSASSGDESDHHEQRTMADGGQLKGADKDAAAGAERANQQAAAAQPAARQQAQRRKPNAAGRAARTPARPAEPVDAEQQPPEGADKEQQQEAAQVNARLAQVVQPSAAPSEGADKDQQPGGQLSAAARLKAAAPAANSCCPSGQLRRQDNNKSAIDLALEGVEQLERGRTDEALRALTLALAPAGKGREQVGVAPARKAANERADEAQAAGAVDELRVEVAKLKMRLFQAHTLNDNLVAELRWSREQQQQQQAAAAAAAQPCANQFALAEQHEQHEQPAAQRQRSVVYLNGTLLQQRGEAPCARCAGELIELLRYLLDKVHFHHGRTFELVSECQKLAMNALLASYSHQMSLVHHNGAVLEGNRAAAAAAAAAQSAAGADGCPVRPPPRRRNASSRMIGASELHQPPAAQQAAATGEQAAKGGATALQVAKQTLFSIVPIYYNSANGNSPRNNRENNNAPANRDEQLGAAGELWPAAARDEQQAAAVSSRRQQPSAINKLATKSKSWILLNSANKQPKEPLEADCPLAACASGQQNVSVLEINRPPAERNSVSLAREQQQLQQAQQPAGFADLASAQHHHQRLVKVKNSLSEDIERHRVRFNGQLLDLLTRQNWCESVISEKLKLYQAGGANGPSSASSSSSSSCATLNRLSVGSAIGESHFQLMQTAHQHTSTQVSCHSHLIGQAQAVAKSAATNVPINSISLNPNGAPAGLTTTAFQQQQICINQSQSSFC